MMLQAINTFSMAEDNVVNQKLATALLTKWGHAVTMADNGKRALAVAKSRIAGRGSGDSGQPHGIRHLPAGSFYEVEAHSRKNRIEPSASGTE